MGRRIDVRGEFEVRGNLKAVVSSALSEELDRLKRETGACHELTVRWVPNPRSDRHGEVKGTVVYVYDEEPEEALLTLKHEFVDYYVSKEIVKPLVKWINMEKCLIEDLIYKRKERVVEGLLKIL